MNGKQLKYKAHRPPEKFERTWPDKTLCQAPTWCSVDLRDGNQALPNPMNVETKIAFFHLLCEIGFQEIEIGFPAASETEFAFCRKLIEENHIPENVTVQVLVQARPDLIAKTFQALQGARRAIIHLYNSTNPAQRKIVFGKTVSQIQDIAVQATEVIKDLASKNPQTQWVLQYSPESFSLTELPVAADICNAVIRTWNPTAEEPAIINLPATVESTTPNVYADQIEWMRKNLIRPDRHILSLHTHNDRGTGIAATELGLLAGATRVEGTLFGNGERTGNVDIVTLALNLLSQGIHPQLNLHNLPKISEAYTEATGMDIHDRHPYAGRLAFTAFSGSHQDAIAKGLKAQDPTSHWEVPYLPIDPADIGREYEPIIRINSQSGKGGIAFSLAKLGFHIPKKAQPEIGAFFKKVTDAKGSEISPEEIETAFLQEFVNVPQPRELVFHQIQTPDTTKAKNGNTLLITKLKSARKTSVETNEGNGTLDAFAKILGRLTKKKPQIALYEEHAHHSGNTAQAIAYVLLDTGTLGIGIDTSIETAALKALLTASNRQQKK